MCKTKRVFFIDSNNRNASSASGSDFTIDLAHQLTLPDGCGVAVDSFNLPTITDDNIVIGINNKVYCQLGIVLKVLFLQQVSTDATDVQSMANVLQIELNNAFPVAPALQNVPTQWETVFKTTGNVVSVIVVSP